MDHAGGQPAQGHHFVLVQDAGLVLDFPFQAPNLTQISDEAHGSRVFIRYGHTGDGHLDRNTLAGFPQQGRFEQGQPAAVPLIFREEGLFQPGFLLRHEKAAQAFLANHRILVPAQHGGGAAIEGYHQVVGVAADDAVHGAFNEVVLKGEGRHELTGGVVPALFQKRGVVLQLPAVAVARFGPLQGHRQGLAVKGFGDEIGGIQLQGPNGEIHLAKGGGDDDFGIRIAFFDVFQDGDAVHFRHADVGDDDLGMNRFAKGQPAHAVVGRVNDITGIFQGDAGHPSDAFLIVNQNDTPFAIVRHQWILQGEACWGKQTVVIMVGRPGGVFRPTPDGI